MQDIIPPDFNKDQLPEESLRNIAYCPVCHHHYNPIQAKVVEEGNGAHLIYVKCNRCQSSILALILAGSFGISSVGLITDLDSYEVSKFCRLSPISSNEVIKVHQKLAETKYIHQLFS